MRRHRLGIIKIASINHDGILQLPVQAIQVQAGEFIPFGEDQESIGSAGRLVGVTRVLDTRIQNLPRPLLRRRIVGRNLAALLQQGLHQQNQRVIRGYRRSRP